MISYLTSAKAFRGTVGMQQATAIRSWHMTHRGAEVLLYGQSEGAEDACSTLGATHVPDVRCIEGIPDFSAIVADAAQRAANDIQCYVNCDIALTPTVARAISAIPFPDFLMIGQRLDLSAGVAIDLASLANPQYCAELHRAGELALHPPGGVDYFVFRRGMFVGMLSAMVGRSGYDGAVLAFCLRRRIPVVDATMRVAAYHQAHDYAHIPESTAARPHGKTPAVNTVPHRLTRSHPLVSDAEYILEEGGLRRWPARGDGLRALELRVRFAWGHDTAGMVVRALWRAREAAIGRRGSCYSLDMVVRALSASGGGSG